MKTFLGLLLIGILTLVSLSWIGGQYAQDDFTNSLIELIENDILEEEETLENTFTINPGTKLIFHFSRNSIFENQKRSSLDVDLEILLPPPEIALCI